MCPFYVRKTNFFGHKAISLYVMQILYTAFAGWRGDSMFAVLDLDVLIFYHSLSDGKKQFKWLMQ